MKKLLVSLMALMVCLFTQATITSITQLRLSSSTNNYSEIILAVDDAASTDIAGSPINMTGKSIAIYAIGAQNLATASATELKDVLLGLKTDEGTLFTIKAMVVQGEPLVLYDALHPDDPMTLYQDATYEIDNLAASSTIENRLIINKSATPPADTQELPSSLGTFVSDKKVASVTGAVLYEIIATDGVSNITFQEVNMTNGLAAGTPVLYQKTDATAFVTFTDDAPINGVYANANGFVGLLPGNNPKEEYMEDGDLWALVSDGKLKFVDTYCTLTPGHAYIDMNAINPQQPAPGRRRLMIGRSGIVTDVENVAAEVKGARKSIENGKIVILKNGIKYNVAGQMMK